MIDTLFLQAKHLKDFYEFQNITNPEKIMATSVFVTWRGDNCKATTLNKQREYWAIIGDKENSKILQELEKDVEDFLYFKEISKQFVPEMQEKITLLNREKGMEDHHYTLEQKQIEAPIYRPVPKEFKTEEEFLAYLNHPKYELTEDRPGICFGVQVHDNIGTKDEEVNGTDI